MSNQFCLKWNNHSKAFGQSIRISQTKESFCDATLVCQGKYYPVHRFILSTCSSYFEDIFVKVKFQHLCVVCQDIDPNELELLLNYMYQGEVNVEKERLPTLIKAAEALKIKGLAVADDDISSPSKSGKKRNRHTDADQSDFELKKNSRKKLNQELNHQSITDMENCASNEVSIAANEVEKRLHAEPEIDGDLKINIKKEIEESFAEESLQNSFNDDLHSSTTFLPRSSEEQLITAEETDFLGYVDNYSYLNNEEVLPNTSDTFQNSSIENLISSDRNENFSCHLQPNTHSKNISVIDTGPLNKRDNLFSCSYCNYSTNKSYNIKQHMITHTGERPFACSQCCKRFARKESLQYHIRVHSGETPFQCPKCSLKFRMKRLLFRHIENKHRKL